MRVINGSFPNWLRVLSGAPKGSVFRPLLFLFYIYDIHQSIYYSVALMLTDVIYVQGYCISNTCFMIFNSF